MSNNDNETPKKTLRKNTTSDYYSTTSDEQLEDEPEFKDLKKDLTPTMQKEPLNNKGDKFNKLTSGEPTAPTDAERSEEEQQQEQQQEHKEEQAEETEEEPEPSETRITHRETNLSTNEIMKNYNAIIDEFYKDNDAEKYFKRIRYLTIMIPDNKFDEVAETEAEKLAQMNINGVKLFKDVAEARQFLHDLRYGRRNRFKGQYQKVYKLPKLQKMIKQSEQKNNMLSPMMSRNLKPLTRTNYIYEY